MALLRPAQFAIALFLAPSVAYAQGVPGATISSNKILHALQTATATYGPQAAEYGLELFAGLAIITFTFAVGYSVMQEQGFNPLAFGAILVRQVVYFGFWAWFLTNWSAGPIGADIIKSFQHAASTMGGVDADPASIVSQGFNVAAQILQQASVWAPGKALWLALAALFIYGLFLWIAVLMIMAIAKAYIAILVGGMAMGFAGFPETRHLAYNAVFMTIGAGARMFMIQLLAGMGATILLGAAGVGTLGETDILVILALMFIWAALSFTLPSLAEHMFGGAGHGRAGAGQLVYTAASFAGYMTAGAQGLGGALGSAGQSMQQSLRGGGGRSIGGGGGGGRLPSGPSGGSGGSSSAVAGMRMRPANARFTPTGGP